MVNGNNKKKKKSSGVLTKRIEYGADGEPEKIIRYDRETGEKTGEFTPTKSDEDEVSLLTGKQQRATGITTPEGTFFAGGAVSELKEAAEREIARRQQLVTGAGAQQEGIQPTTEQIQQLQQSGILEAEEPQRRELEPTRGDIGIPGVASIPTEEIPVVGAGIDVAAILTEKALQYLPGFKEVEPFLLQPGVLDNVMRQEIENEVFDQGLTAAEEFGAVIEAIPVAGGIVNRYARGLIETPAANVRTIVSEIESERERASILASMVREGKIDPQLAIQQLDEMSDNISRLESRINLLLNFSAELRTNSDEVNRIEEKILRTRERIFEARQSAGVGMIRPPSTEDLFLTLRDLKLRLKGGE